MGVSATTSRWDALRGIASAALLVQFAADRGVPAGRSLRGTGITATALRDHDAEISGRQEQALARNIVRALGDPPGLGLQAGALYGLPTYGIFGFALLSSSTLREALAVAERYRELAYALVEVTLEVAGGEARIAFEDADTLRDVRRFGVERDASAITLLQRDLFSAPVPLSRVTFRFQAPPSIEPYVETFGVAPVFGAPQNLIALDGSLLDEPLPRASPYAARQCQNQCRELLARRLARGGIAGQVRDELLRDPRRMPSQDEVAAALHISVRTLRRQLAGHGTSFRELVGETRALLAEELLETGQLTIEDVADRLGYSEASSFVHAFKRWRGMPPSRYARAHRALPRNGKTPATAGASQWAVEDSNLQPWD